VRAAARAPASAGYLPKEDVEHSLAFGARMWNAWTEKT
jgi:hypothetical protein